MKSTNGSSADLYFWANINACANLLRAFQSTTFRELVQLMTAANGSTLIPSFLPFNRKARAARSIAWFSFFQTITKSKTADKY